MKYWLLLAVVFFGFLGLEEGRAAENYFPYTSEEIAPLKQLHSSYQISKSTLKEWDLLFTEKIRQERLSFYEALRIFTYVYVAQREAAFLSHCLKGSYEGSLAPLLAQLFSHFFSQTPHIKTQRDPYSEKLAEIVFAKLAVRLAREDQLPFAFKVDKKQQADFSAGLFVEKWIPWYTKPSMAYWPPAPPSDRDPCWQQEIATIHQLQQPMTPEKQERIRYWAGMTGPGSGDWRAIANQFLFEQKIPLGKVLQVRALLMMGLYDGVTVYMGAKYHYAVIRPHRYDSQVHYQIDVPKHPSYPSGHSTESMIAASILSCFFPEQSEKWHRLAIEAGLSRIWAGIHYPLDHQAGRALGQRIAKKVLDASNTRCAGSPTRSQNRLRSDRTPPEASSVPADLPT